MKGTYHVSALFGARFLVFEMDSRSPALHEHFDELHDRSEPPVAGVPVSNDGLHGVDRWLALTLRGGPLQPLHVVVAIVQLLREKQLLHLAKFRISPSEFGKMVETPQYRKSDGKIWKSDGNFSAIFSAKFPLPPLHVVVAIVQLLREKQLFHLAKFRISPSEFG